jgi:beta-glucanase (GH16 family)
VLQKNPGLVQPRTTSIYNLVLLKTLSLALILMGTGSTAFAEVLWSDEFDTGTSLNQAVWSYDLGASGWGNMELQEYTNKPENVRIEDGNLVITVQKNTNAETDSIFTSARVQTKNKLTFKYGTIEARIKMPDLADGLWPAFWTLGDNIDLVGWPSCGELDIVEMGSTSAISTGTVNRRVGSTAHWENNEQWVYYSRALNSPSDLNGEFHVFRMEWTPTLITTYIDGQQIWAFNIESKNCTDCSEFHQPHHMLLNVAVGGTYTGLLDNDQITAATPAEMQVDYVRIMDNGFTELGGSAAPEVPLPGLEYSGAWYNADQSGHGFAMVFGEAADGSPLAVVYWYIYDTLGNPIFFVGTGVPDGNTLEVQFTSPYGMKYGEFDPDSVNREDGGTAYFEFTDKDNANFSYIPSEFSTSTWGHSPIESLPLTRLFGVPPPAPESLNK